MNEIITLLVVAEGIILGWDIARRVGLFSPASVYVAFTTVDLAIFAWIFEAHLNKLNFTFTAMPWPAFDAVYLKTIAIYSLLIWVGWLASLGLRRYPKSTPNLLEQVTNTLPWLRKIFPTLLALIALVTFWMEVFHLWDIDLAILWQNQTYLMINNPVLAGLDTLPGRLIHLALRPLGLFLVGMGAFLTVKRRRSWGSIFLLLSLYPFLIALAQNSRWAPLYLFAIALIFGVVGGIRYLPQTVVLSVLGFVVFLKVLVGRNTPFQGVAGIDDGLLLVFSRFDFEAQRWLVGFFLNIFQGAQNLANAFLIYPQYPDVYKLLSFSPTISAIDHFDQLMGAYLVKIAPVVPLSTYSEAYFFGLGYFFALLFILLVWLRVMTRLSLRQDLFGSAFTLFSYWVIFYVSQYPVRNSMRFIYLSLLLGILLNRLQAKKGGDKHIRIRDDGQA